MDTVNVLVLDPNPRVLHTIKNLPQDVLEKYWFIYHNQNEYPSLQDSLEDAEEIVRKKNIKVVLPTSDNGALVKAALMEEFPHLRGPSVKSVFLAYNKYYTRCFLDPQPIPFASLDLSTANLDKACEEALVKVGIPAFFKPTVGYMSKGVFSVEDGDHLKQVAKSYITSRNITDDGKFMNSFYARNIDKRKYPLASKPTAIVEEHMGLTTTVINTDSYVFDGKIHHWSISDSVYSKTDPLYYLGGFHPTSLPESSQKKVWNSKHISVRR